MALSRLALSISKFKTHELSMTKEFEMEDWKTLVKNVIKSAAAESTVNVINMQDNQISDEVVFIDLNCLLKNGNLPDLVHIQEQNALILRMKQS